MDVGVQLSSCSRPPRKSGRRLVSSKNYLFIAPVHNCPKKLCIS